jgi:serine/threonine protein kinase/predicted Zn-dependent protease
MVRSSRPHPVGELDEFIAAYEDARARSAHADWTHYLPGRDHPLYRAALREFVRIDLETGWDQGRPRRLEEYEQLFPELANDRDGFREIAFEEYRLRCLAGQNPSLTEYEERYGIVTDGWSAPGSDTEMVESAPPDEAGLPMSRTMAADQVDMLRDLYDCDPLAAQRWAEVVNQFPNPGSFFLEFELLAELGRGTFGRVYLARQGDLANRYVALKVGADLYNESQTLAQLQHTHIMPIYSIHQAGPLQAVCMPFLGTTTLADLSRDLQQRKSLPASGKSLVQTLDARKSATRFPGGGDHGLRSNHRESSMAAGDNGSPSPAGDQATENLQMLAQLTHVQAVLWIASRVAHGLAHAHGQGILHRDLKPANILLTDEGQPMLLDFNLSSDTKLRNNASAALLGGTLPYMAPEHLEAYQGAPCSVDARSDLYALGVILYEMLAGRPPYEVPRGSLSELLPRLSAARRQPPPDLRRWNKAASPAVASIVRHCLEPEPGRRYQSARELRDDLECQLANQRLRHASEPSFTERAQKWMRRHPRLTSSTSVGIIALFAVLGLGGVLFLRGQQLARLEARDSLRLLADNLKTVRFLLHDPQLERRQLEEGVAVCEQVAERYQILGSSSWNDLPTVRRLAPDEQQTLRDDLGELLFLWARACSLLIRTAPSNAGRQEIIARALHLNELAATFYAPELRPPALTLQRARLLELSGRHTEAQELKARAEQEPMPTDQNQYLLLADQMGQGRWRAVLPLLRQLSRQAPQDYSWWLLLGNCHAGLGQLAEAAACYDLGIALRPDAIWAYFNRGLLYLEHKKFAQAEADFDQVIRLRPDLAAALFNRALAKYGSKDYQGALADLTQMMEGGTSSTRAYLVRSRVRALLGNGEGAREDHAEAMRREPGDEQDWIARGVARVGSAPQQALADFDKALELNPKSRASLQNKASVLSEKMNRAAEAIAVLDQVVSLYPDYVPGRAGRGVLLARLGQREAAHTDAHACLAQTTEPGIVYQVAGIYSLTSRQHPDDRREAFRLLSAALSKGFGFDLLERDADLDPVRNRPEFRQIVEAARALAPQNRGESPAAVAPR